MQLPKLLLPKMLASIWPAGTVKSNNGRLDYVALAVCYFATISCCCCVMLRASCCCIVPASMLFALVSGQWKTSDVRFQMLRSTG